MGCARCGAERMFRDPDWDGASFLCVICGARVWSADADFGRRLERRRLDPRDKTQIEAGKARRMSGDSGWKRRLAARRQGRARE